MTKTKATTKKRHPSSPSQQSETNGPPSLAHKIPSTPETIAKRQTKKDSPFSFKIRTASPKKKIKKENPVLIKFALVPNACIGIHFAYRYQINSGPYAEKLFHDSAQGQSEWTREIHLSKLNSFFCINNVKQKHYPESPYHIRYFFLDMVIDETEQDTDKAIVQLANYIAGELNGRLSKKGQVQVSDDITELIWKRDAVVSDLIDSDSAIFKLFNQMGPIDNSDDFQHNVDYIHTFFRKGEIPPRFKSQLKAPTDEVAAPPPPKHTPTEKVAAPPPPKQI